MWLITLFENRNSFVTFSPNCLKLIFFSCLIALTRTSSTIWIRSEERSHPRHFFEECVCVCVCVCVCLSNAKYLFFLLAFTFSFLTHELFKIIFLNFQIFKGCSDTFCFISSSSSFFWPDKLHWIISVILNFPWLFYSSEYGLTWWIIHVHSAI